jgi:hypothetical protein
VAEFAGDAKINESPQSIFAAFGNFHRR